MYNTRTYLYTDIKRRYTVGFISDAVFNSTKSTTPNGIVKMLLRILTIRVTFSSLSPHIASSSSISVCYIKTDGFDKTDRYALFAEYFLFWCFFNVWMVFPLKKHRFHVFRYDDGSKIKIKPYTTRLRWRVLSFTIEIYDMQ